MGFCVGVGHVVGGVLLEMGKEAGKEKKGKSKTKNNNKHKYKHKYKYAKLAIQTVGAMMCCKTFVRCFEWRSERSLFESALTVCPSSLKVLNNLALVLLDNSTARWAGELLDKALLLHPNYPSALFNKGLVHHLYGEDLLAIEMFEKSLFYEMHQPKTRAYLSQSKMSLGFELQRLNRHEEAYSLLEQSLVMADAAIFQVSERSENKE
tara:strand:+ start:166 stop:789 length:624 start_codon:yes stop_codon:yes gene_type:complete